MTAYYNEFDKHAAAWLRELIKRDLIAPGDVDERSIKDVKPDDLKGYDQVHLFAGIGGWSYALRLAGVADDAAVWTGSCPCQPFSNAGKRRGVDDERHLWPEMRRLIEECRPAIVFGEQIASKDGREWLAGVFDDLEAMGYAAAGADLCAAGVGAPHIRQRLYWFADANTKRLTACPGYRQYGGQYNAESCSLKNTTDRPRDTASEGSQGEWSEHRSCSEGSSGFVGLAMQVGVPEWNGGTVALKYTDGARRASAEPGAFPLAHGVPARVVRLRGYGNAIVPAIAAEFIQAYIEAVNQ